MGRNKNYANHNWVRLFLKTLLKIVEAPIRNLLNFHVCNILNKSINQLIN